MSRLPQLHDKLVRAAAAHFEPAAEPKPVSWRSRWQRTILIAGLATVGSAATAGAVLVATGTIGGSPSKPVPRVAGEEASGMTRLREPRVLGIATLPISGRLELIGYRMRGYGGNGELLCIDVAVGGGRSGSCSSGPPAEAGGIGGGLGLPGSPILATGSTAADVARIDVTYPRDGVRSTAAAVLIRVPAAQAAPLGADPFTFYAAELPSDARDARAAAYADNGTRLWDVSFRR